MSEEQYTKLRTHYKWLSVTVLIIGLVIALLIVAFLMTNKNSDKIMLKGTQYFFLFLSLIALCFSITLHLHYLFILLPDPASYFSKNFIIYSLGKNKTLVERITINRKAVYNNTTFFWIGLLCLLVVGLIWLQPSPKDVAKQPQHVNVLSDSALYTLALKYANTPSEEKICRTLVAINNNTIKYLEPDSVKKKKHIKVYAAKGEDRYSKNVDSNKFYKTQEWQIWVFTKKDFFEKYKLYANEDSVHRVKQLLGLPPDKQINYVVSFLVDPTDLFRPCLDAEITDCLCGLAVPSSANSNHVNYVKDWSKDAYLDATKYPFTQLGYTFDWNPYNFSHIGVSEFIIDKYKQVKLDTVMPIQDFLRKGMTGYK